MFIEAYPSGPFETNAYIAACEQTRLAAIIDPAPGSADDLINALEAKRFNPVAILLTHSHWDHIADVAPLKKRYQIPVYIHAMDAPNLENPGADTLPYWIHIDSVIPDRLIKEGDTLEIGHLHFTVIETPGHTPGGVCYYSADDHLLFSGDTLFKGTIGNISFATARPELMWSSLDKLSRLPPNTKVYPGHGESTTIGNEPWLKNAREVFG